MSSSVTEEFKFWVEKALVKENLVDLTLEAEKAGEENGNIGDVIFVNVEGTTKDGSRKTYNLVAKCGKNSPSLRKLYPVKAAYENEIYIYEKLFPMFVDFQKEKDLEDIFDNVPQTFGSYQGDSMEIVLLQNMKKIGFQLWDKKQPMPSDHIYLIIREYGKLHAISAAIKDQDPTKFEEIQSRLTDVWTPFLRTGLFDVFKAQIGESVKILEGHVEQKILDELKTLEDKSAEIMLDPHQCFKLVLHGDCWNNNFMFKYQDGDLTKIEKATFLDWQMCRMGCPALDLSYFLFSCLSSEDMEDLQHILIYYYECFVHHGNLLGSDLSEMYPFQDFFKDWKKFASYGFIISLLVYKVCLTEKEDSVDMGDATEEGKSLQDVFVNNHLENKDQLRVRLKYAVEYAYKYGLILNN